MSRDVSHVMMKVVIKVLAIRDDVTKNEWQNVATLSSSVFSVLAPCASVPHIQTTELNSQSSSAPL